MAKKASKDSGSTAARVKKTAASRTSDKPETVPVEIKKGEAVVTVYCMLPNGMSFPTPAGLVTLNGANTAQLVGGYGKTTVPKKAWGYIKSVYASMKVFSADNPVIFEADSAARGDDAADEQEESVTTGMEQKAPGDIIKRAEALAGNKQPKNED